MQPVIKSPVYVYVEYPKWQYHATQNPVLVADAAAHAALGPGWFDRPVTGAAQAETAKAVETIAETVSVDDARAQSEAAELYAAPIATIVGLIGTMKARTTLERVRDFELANPRPEGARKRVIDAIEKRLAALAEPA